MKNDLTTTLSGFMVWLCSIGMDVTRSLSDYMLLENINKVVGFIAAVVTIWAGLRTVKAKNEVTKSERLNQMLTQKKLDNLERNEQ